MSPDFLLVVGRTGWGDIYAKTFCWIAKTAGQLFLT